MSRVLVTGVGVVSPIASGNDLFAKALLEGVLPRFDKRIESVSGAYYAAADRSDIHRQLSDRSLRRAADVSKYAIAAVKMALDDAGMHAVDSDNTALVVGVTNGPLAYTQQFHHSIVAGYPADASPFLFSDSVLNAVASNCSLLYKIKGPVHTLVCGRAASLKSLMLAVSLLKKGEVKRALVVASEEISEIAFSCYTRMGVSNMSEGAAALMLTVEDVGGLNQPYCEILSSSSYCMPGDQIGALDVVLSKCFGDAGMTSNDIDMVLYDSDGVLPPEIKGAVARSVMERTGNSFAVNALWHIVASCMLFKDVKIAEAILGHYSSGNLKNIVVASSENSGAASAAVLRRA